MIYSNLSRKNLACWWALSVRCGPAAKLPFQLWKQSKGVWSEIDLSELKVAHAEILDALKPEKAMMDFSKLNASLEDGVHLLGIDSTFYPSSLWDLKTPPLFLFVKGEVDLLDGDATAVVGTRQPDREALRLTHMVVQRRVGISPIISGGAIGIDTQVHQSTIDEGGKTIVVLPSGIQAPSPRSNIALFGDVVDSGGVIISEYSPFSTPRKFHFHRRNALLAALSDALIVVRARKKSGTLISAKAASDLGRSLYAIPGSPLDPLSEGPNFLIASGEARLFDFAAPAQAPRMRKARLLPLEGSEARVFKHLKLAKNVDELAASIPDMSANEILSVLTLLEIGGYIEADKKRGGYKRT